MSTLPSNTSTKGSPVKLNEATEPLRTIAVPFTIIVGAIGAALAAIVGMTDAQWVAPAGVALVTFAGIVGHWAGVEVGRPAVWNTPHHDKAVGTAVADAVAQSLTVLPAESIDPPVGLTVGAIDPATMDPPADPTDTAVLDAAAKAAGLT